MKPYRFLDEADIELQEHIAYLNEQGTGLASKFVADVDAALLDIREYPEIGSRITRRVRKKVLHTFHYDLVYVDTRHEIVIIAVALQQRRPGYWRNRLRDLRH